MPTCCRCAVPVGIPVSAPITRTSVARSCSPGAAPATEDEALQESGLPARSPRVHRRPRLKPQNGSARNPCRAAFRHRVATDVEDGVGACIVASHSNKGSNSHVIGRKNPRCPSPANAWHLRRPQLEPTGESSMGRPSVATPPVRRITARLARLGGGASRGRVIHLAAAWRSGGSVSAQGGKRRSARRSRGLVDARDAAGCGDNLHQRQLCRRDLILV